MSSALAMSWRFGIFWYIELWKRWYHFGHLIPIFLWLYGLWNYQSLYVVYKEVQSTLSFNFNGIYFWVKWYFSQVLLFDVASIESEYVDHMLFDVFTCNPHGHKWLLHTR